MLIINSDFLFVVLPATYFCQITGMLEPVVGYFS